MNAPSRVNVPVLMLMGTCLLESVSTWAAESPPGLPGAKQIAFTPDGTNGFVFDTGLLRGRLRAGGQSRGLTEVVHVPSGLRLDRSMGLFSHYRVFTTNKRYGGGAWDWPSQAALKSDGSVEVHWPATPERPFELRAIYRWSAADTLDLETTVQASADLRHFESFLASYFAEGFSNALACVGLSVPGTEAGFLRATPDRGAWLTFPRDAAAESVYADGRWKLEPSPVDWVMLPRLSRPIGLRRAPFANLTVAAMSRTKDCFAISMPQETEGHFSLYLSLFGRDVKVGESARARARMVIGQHLSTARLIAIEEALQQDNPEAARTGVGTGECGERHSAVGGGNTTERPGRPAEAAGASGGVETQRLAALFHFLPAGRDSKCRAGGAGGRELAPDDFQALPGAGAAGGGEEVVRDCAEKLKVESAARGVGGPLEY